ncbi:hypothetical protein CerSpe_010170 [Prunus speciosa]
MLVSPKLLPGFGYKNHPLGIEEASYQLAVDTTLIHSNKQEEASTIKAAGKAWYQTMISDSDYTEFDNFTKWLGVSQ